MELNRQHLLTSLAVAVLMLLAISQAKIIAPTVKPTSGPTKHTVVQIQSTSSNNVQMTPTSSAAATTAATAAATTANTSVNTTNTSVPTNSTSSNSPTTKPGSNGNSLAGILGTSDKNFKMYVRAFYVVIAITGLVVIYLGVKTFILRRRKRKARHYGVLNDQQLELHAVDDEDEDDLFDQSRRRLIS